MNTKHLVRCRLWELVAGCYHLRIILSVSTQNLVFSTYTTDSLHCNKKIPKS